MIKTFILITILFVAGPGAINALYNSGDPVVELTSSNFKTRVLDDDAVWIVEFYSPNCGHCVQFAPAYKQAAKALKGIVKVGAVNANDHGELTNKYGIRGYPTVKIFSHDKSKPEEFQGQRTADALTKEALSSVKRMIDKRLGKSSGGGDSGPAEVVELTENNFDQKVLKSSDSWIIGFFAPWCGHCKSMKPDYEQASKRLKGKVKFGSVDATVHTNLASKYNVKGYPTLYFFGTNKLSPELYNGGRSADEMVAFLDNKVVADLPPPKANQLLKQDQLEECKEVICVIAALPDLLDCQSKCRNDYIKMIEKSGEKHKSHGWKYFWFPATTQPNAEKAFNLGGFGYPAMVALSGKKMKYAPLRGSFSTDGINEFLRDVALASRSVSLQDVPELPKIIPTEPWDGKDGKLPEVEEIDLDSLKDEL